MNKKADPRTKRKVTLVKEDMLDLPLSHPGGAGLLSTFLAGTATPACDIEASYPLYQAAAHGVNCALGSK